MLRLLLAALLAAAPAPAFASGDSLESLIFALTNDVRAQHGLRPLEWDEAAAEAGRGHCRDMARLGFFEHDSPVPGRRTNVDRVRAAGTDSNVFGENLAVHSLSNLEAPELAGRMVAELMKSPTHRANILSREYRRLGVGAAPGRYQGQGAAYVTQVFLGRPR